MTHVLNFALRKVLGGSVDQKGSSVTDEKLRFDFSLPRAVNETELEKIEEIVRSIIEQGLPVTCATQSLQDAQKIPGLRAVFGEVYPDPVRVVSIGTLTENGSGVDNSVEFCGGTHLTNTAEAVDFAIIEESAVAKGIRRIVAVTGAPAADAHWLGQALQERVQKLGRAVQTNRSAAHNDAAILAERDEILGLLTSSGTLLPALHRAQLTRAIELIKKELYKGKVAQMLKDVEQVTGNLTEEVHAAREKGLAWEVFDVPIVGVDNKTRNNAMEAIKKVHPTLTYLCASHVGENKYVVFASVGSSADSAPSRLSATEWVQNTLKSFGGKGGGKGSTALGSVEIDGEPAQITRNLVHAARLYASKCLK